MKYYLILFSLFMVAGFSISPATIIIVPDDYDNIQAAIDATSNSDTVLVQPGTYVENISFGGHNIVVASMFLMTGDTSYISRTIIDGGFRNSVVKFVRCESNRAELVGFAIKNGVGINAGGICCEHSSPTIRNNIITNCLASPLWGGGIYCYYSSPVIRDNVIEGNSAEGGGGGIYCFESRPGITNNRINRNKTPIYGGGLFCVWSDPCVDSNEFGYNTADCGGGIMCEWYSSPQIVKNRIHHNIARGEGAQMGAGICCFESSSPAIKNNEIINNSAHGHGGGVHTEWYSNPHMINNTIAENWAKWAGGGACCLCYSNPLICNTICWGNTTEISDTGIYCDSLSCPIVVYCDTQCDVWPGEGNMSVDPLFRDPVNGDYHLMFMPCGDTLDSPCIDTGHPGILDSLLDCSRGMGTVLSDMGAHGGGDTVLVEIVDNDHVVPTRFAVLQNYPNPFNGVTTIEYSLAISSYLTVDIYDLLGRRVETLVDGILPAGSHHAIWDAGGQPSGLYFYRIRVGKFSETKKMVLLK